MYQHSSRNTHQHTPADSDKQGWVSGMAPGKLHPGLRWNKSSARSAKALQHYKSSLRGRTFHLQVFMLITGDKVVRVKKSFQSNLQEEMWYGCANRKYPNCCSTWKPYSSGNKLRFSGHIMRATC